MGNVRSRAPTFPIVLRQAVTEGDLQKVRTILSARPELHDVALNKTGDTALLLAARLGHFHLVRELLRRGEGGVNSKNRLGHTVLDLWLSRSLPDDQEILHQHFCPFSPHCSHGEQAEPRLSEETKWLLGQGADGLSLHRLILVSMRQPRLIRDLIHVIRDLAHPARFRVSGLLLQACVWFEQHDNLLELLTLGVDMLNFWRAPFSPTLRNLIDLDYDFMDVVRAGGGACDPVGRLEGVWRAASSTHSSSHVDPTCGSTYEESLQNLKLSFIEDWRADWNEGENPEAQFRAGLHITPEAAVLLVRAATSEAAMEQVLVDVSGYRPAALGGPDLGGAGLVETLLLAGYTFPRGEWHWLAIRGVPAALLSSLPPPAAGPPPALRHLARLAVRRSLRVNVFYAMARLPRDRLPRQLREYVMLGPATPQVD